jgi:hypothetical protein
MAGCLNTTTLSSSFGTSHAAPPRGVFSRTLTTLLTGSSSLSACSSSNATTTPTRTFSSETTSASPLPHQSFKEAYPKIQETLDADAQRFHVPSQERGARANLRSARGERYVRYGKRHWWRPVTEEEKSWHWGTQLCGERRFKWSKPVVPRGKFPTFFRTKRKVLSKFGVHAATHTPVNRIPPMKYIQLHEEDLQRKLKETGNDETVVPINAATEKPLAFRPLLFNGRWRQPRFSRRKIALLRKETLLLGEEWPAAYELEAKQSMVRLRKGRKSARSKFDRWERIEAALETMDARIEDHKQKMRDGRKNQNVFDSYLEK